MPRNISFEERERSGRIGSRDGAVLVFDPFAGISGDMILGALIDAGASPDALRTALEPLELGGYEIKVEKKMIRGLSATSCRVELDKNIEPGHTPHSCFTDIRNLIIEAELDERVTSRALAVFEALAEAEGTVHGVPKEKVSFHEVGAVDSIIDIVGAAAALEQLGVARIHTRPIRCGSGAVKTAHGMLPVPAPATALLLRGFDVQFDDEKGEKTTPTGAAVLAALASPLPSAPPGKYTAVGYGAGAREGGKLPNLLRVFLGEDTVESGGEETAVQIETDIDDMNPEYLPYVADLLLDAGALDVRFVQSIMKKGRPGVTVSILAGPGDVTSLGDILFSETTTLGMRWWNVGRRVLHREIETVDTKYGSVRIKKAALPGGGLKSSPEYEDCARAARETGAPIREVYLEVLNSIPSEELIGGDEAGDGSPDN